MKTMDHNTGTCPICDAVESAASIYRRLFAHEYRGLAGMIVIAPHVRAQFCESENAIRCRDHASTEHGAGVSKPALQLLEVEEVGLCSRSEGIAFVLRESVEIVE